MTTGRGQYPGGRCPGRDAVATATSPTGQDQHPPPPPLQSQTAGKAGIIIITVKSFMFVGHLISCTLWVAQSMNLRSK